MTTSKSRRRKQAPPNVDQLTFHDVDQARWPDFVSLFEARGGPKACWCSVWRPAGNRGTSAEKKNRLAQIVDGGEPIGILGYLDDEPVVWCSIAPRHTYRKLGGGEEAGETVWSLVCFYVVRRLRGHGLSAAALDAAIAWARQRGATVVEAFPVDPDSPTYHFMGTVPMFEAAGFEHRGPVGKRRRAMRLSIVK